MTKKRTNNTKFSTNKSRQRRFPVHKKRMPIIKCLCGTEILVVPDLKAMNKAIANHVATKHKTTPDELEKLADFLSEQALLEATRTQTSARN